MSICIETKDYGVKTLLVDDVPLRDLHPAIFGKYHFEVKSLKELEEVEKKKVKNFVYRKLSQKNYASFELQKILKDYQTPHDLIETILQECIQLGYLNDQDWIASFIRSCKAKKWGPRQIIQKMIVKGLDPEIAENALNEADLPEDRHSRIKILIETKYKNKDLTIFSEKQKVIAALLRKGFSFEDIRTSMYLI